MEQVAMTLDSKGYLLEEMGRHEDELAVYDELISRYGDSTEPALMKRVAKALFNKGYRFGEMGQHEDALAAYDKLLTRYGDNAESALMKQVTMALFNKGIQFGEMGQHEDALAAYVELIRRYGDSAEPALMERVAKALVNKGYRLGQMGQHEEELAAYDELLSRYGDSAETVLMEQVAKALGNKGYRLGQMGRHEDELATYNELISRYGDSTEPALMESIVNGLFNKGYRLKEMGRQEEAIAAYDELLNRYGNSTEPALMEQVATAFAYRASLRASILLSQNRFEKFSALTKEQLERYPENSRLHNVLAWAVYKHRARPFYLEAAGWATIAANISKNAEHYHTLACLLCIQGKGEEALAPAALYLADTTLVINRLEDAIDLFVGLAAAGQAKEALAMLEKSAAAPHLEPLLVGLRLYLSLEVTAAQEIREIGHDVVKRIETRKQEIA